MRREVVVDEELPAHEVEWEVVNCPNQKEETSRVPKTIADSYRTSSISTLHEDYTKLTFGNWIDCTATGDQICTKNTNIDGEGEYARPPSYQVTDEVDLLLALILGPEADSTEEERPIDRCARIRM